jgi:hypothetical protein
LRGSAAVKALALPRLSLQELELASALQFESA